MEYRAMGNSGLIVSSLALGTMNFGTEIWGCDESTGIALVHAYLEAGGNFVDVANVYAGGESERIVGKALKGRRRDVVLATKCSAPVGGLTRRGSSRSHIMSEVEASLRRLQAETIDLYYLHLWDPTTPFLESLSALTDLVRSGKVRYLGVSNYAGWQISQMAGLRQANNFFEPLVSAQEQYSLLFRGIEHEVVPACRHNGLGIVAYSPLGGGVLAGVYTPSGEEPKDERYTAEGSYAGKFRKFYLTDRNFHIYDQVSGLAESAGSGTIALSIGWLLGKPAVSSVLVGPRTVEQLETYLAAGAAPLSADLMAELDRISVPELPYPYSFQARYISEFFGSVRHQP